MQMRFNNALRIVLLIIVSFYVHAQTLLSKEENEYQISQNPSPTTDANTRNLVTENYRWENMSIIDKYVYGARYYYYLDRGIAQLTKSIRKEYSPTGDSIQTVTEYTYDNDYYVPKLIKITHIKGEVVEIRNNYAFDYNLTKVSIDGFIEKSKPDSRSSFDRNMGYRRYSSLCKVLYSMLWT